MGTRLRVISENSLMNPKNDKFWKVFKNVCIFVLWTKVVLALEGLREIVLHNSMVSNCEKVLGKPQVNNYWDIHHDNKIYYLSK